MNLSDLHIIRPGTPATVAALLRLGGHIERRGRDGGADWVLLRWGRRRVLVVMQPPAQAP